MSTESSAKPRLRFGFLRGADFGASLGQTDWRIGLFMPEFGFDTWIFGRGEGVSTTGNGVRLVGVKASSLPIVPTLQMSLSYSYRVIRHDLDFIMCNLGIALVGILVKHLRPRIKVALDVRSIPVETHGLSNRLHSLYLDAALKSSAIDAVTVITHGMLEELDARCPIKGRVPTAVWGSGFDPELFRAEEDGSAVREALNLGDKFVLMYHGSQSPTRGLDQAVRCIRMLRDRGLDDVHLVFVGDGPAKFDLGQLVTELGVANEVTFVPPVRHDGIPALVAACDMGIDPLPDHPWWRHQSPLKVYEYLAMRKPVLATDIPCHQDISSAVILARDNAPATLAAAILEYRHLSSHERRRLGHTAFQDAQRHTWRAKAKVLADFIRSQVEES